MSKNYRLHHLLTLEEEEYLSRSLYYQELFMKMWSDRLIEKQGNGFAICDNMENYNWEAYSKQFDCKHNSNHQILQIQKAQKQFTCHICLKAFPHKYMLYQHLLTHADKECDIFQEDFSLKNTLNVHLAIYTEPKNFVCEICQRTFKRKRTLNDHMKIHKGQKDFSCDICFRKFTQKGTLNRHILTHTGEKNYKCDMCSEKFTQKVQLNIHMSIHTGQKDFKCIICLKEFAHKGNLNQHLKIHTNSKDFQCKICFKEFKGRKSLDKHLMMMHNHDDEED